MSVALEHPDWFFLIDDHRPYQVATRRGLRAMCTPLLTVMLLREGSIDDERAMEMLVRLDSLGTVSPRLVDDALEQYIRWLAERGA
ncbi:MAG: hypothetical protein AB7N70_09485 [Dehalococcoidia bacterium]